MKDLNDALSSDQQQDVGEFFTVFLEEIKVNFNQISTLEDTLNILRVKVNELFTAKTIEVYYCQAKDCPGKRELLDNPSLITYLDLEAHNSIYDLNDLVSRYLNPPSLAQVLCERCNDLQFHSKKINFEKVPELIIIQINRYIIIDGQTVKNCSIVNIPEFLNIEFPIA